MDLDISVIIVSYQCAEALAGCLESLTGRAWGVSAEFIVVDNGSTDGAADMVRRRFGQVHLFANPDNRGFAAANNQGLAVARGRHMFFLNPDTLVHPGALERIVETLDADPTIGALGPQLVNPDGSIQPSARRFPTFVAMLHHYTPLRLILVLRGAYRRYMMTGFDFTLAADVDQVMGAAMAVPRSVLDRVGPMDERFFLYFDEVDLCRRIKVAGYRVRFDPSARVTHIGGASSGSAASYCLRRRSLLKYIRKWHGPLAGPLLTAALWAGIVARELLSLKINLLAGAAMALIGRQEKARRLMKRARLAAAYLGLCDRRKSHPEVRL
jgi:GT2 family glycosyltransferase